MTTPSHLEWAAGSLSLFLVLAGACGARPHNSPVDTREVEVLKRAYAAFNRNDIAGAVVDVDSLAEWSEPAEFPGGGTYHGREEVASYLAQSRANWAEGSSEPERFIPVGGRMVVFVLARVRLKSSGQWHETRLADVFTFRNGRIVHMRAFADRDQALRWAGAKP